MAWSSARRGLVGVVVVAAAALVSAAVYPRLPERMVTHWGVTGEPNRWMGRFWGAFFVPALIAALLPFMWYLPRIDPQKEAYGAFRPAYEWFVVGALGFLLYVHALVLAVNLGVDVPLIRVLAPAGVVWPRWAVAFAVVPMLAVTADALVYSYRRHRRAEG